jgi:acetyl-CoA synthetase
MKLIELQCMIFCVKFHDGLPKTRSGKIMRRILRKIAAGDVNNLGELSTLADPSVVQSLVKSRASLSSSKS